jgi:succinoglycan biosynthesis transport protein ExoP
MTKSLPDNTLLNFDPVDVAVIDLREYWNIIRQHLKSILAIMFVAMVLAALVVFSMKPIYRSTATLLIETEAKNILSIEEIYSGGRQSAEYLNTQFEVIKSKSLSRKVIEKLNLTSHPYFLTDEDEDIGGMPGALIESWLPELVTTWWFGLDAISPQNDAMNTVNTGLSAEELLLRGVEKQFSEMMSVSPVSKTQLVHISFEASDNQLAALMAKEMAQMYIIDQMDSRLEITAQANSWLTERLGNIKQKLQKSETVLQAYREKEKLLEAAGVTGLVSSQLLGLNQELITTQQKLGFLEAATEQIRKVSSGNYRNYLSIPAVLNDELVSTLIEGASDRQQEFGTLSKRYGPKHPKIVSARAAYESSNKALKSHVLSVVRGIERQFELTRSSELSTNKILNRTRRELQNINSKQHQLGLLQREVEADRQIYDLFLNRVKETTESRGIDKANARIVDEAFAALKPIRPKKKLIVLIAGFVGLGFGVLMAFIFEYLNNTLKSSRDLEEKLKLVVLGVLPLLPEKKIKDLWRMVNTEPKSLFTEGIRSTHTGIILSSIDNPHKIIMVTSSLPKEGKSTTASNTAINLGETNKVLLIDCDLRRPSIGHLFGLSRNANGLSEMLAGTADPSDCIHRWGETKLFVLPSGAPPPNPLDLLSSNAFKTLLETLSNNYCHIIIDTPPLLPVSDAQIISTLVNGVVIVIKSDATPIPVATDALKRLRQSNAPLLGAVLNQFDAKKRSRNSGDSDYDLDYDDDYYGDSYGELTN